MISTRDAKSVWQALNGVFCVYKPADVSLRRVRSNIITNLCRDLSDLDPPVATPLVSIEGKTNEKLTVQVKKSYIDSPLVLGPLYQNQDIKCNFVLPLGIRTSGVLVMGVNDGTREANIYGKRFRNRSYRINGTFGYATDNYFRDGKTMERSTYDHVKRSQFERLLATMQSSHQTKKFEVGGLDIQSQAAYEFAASGAIHNEHTKTPLIYGIKCVYFHLPHFKIEVHAVNEDENYLLTMVHDMGVQLATTMHTTSIQCFQHGSLSLDNALLKKHWSLQHILDNINFNKQCLIPSNTEYSQVKPVFLNA